MIRVLFDPEIFALQNRGGIPRLFAGLYEEFRNNEHYGIDPIIPPGPWFPYLDTSELPTREKTITRVRKLLLSQFAIARVLGSVDVVQETYYTRWRFLGKKPRVVTVHDMIAETEPSAVSAFQSFTNKSRRVQSASALVVDSKATLGSLQNHMNHSLEPVVIYPGLGKSAGAGRDVIDRDLSLFLYVGTRSGHKDFPTLLLAASLLASQGANIKIRAVGGGPLTPEERELAKDLDLTQCDASDEELSALYQTAVATVVTSREEGFGFPIVESFSAGTEVICSDIEIFRETSKGLANFFQPGNAHDLARVMKNLQADNEMNQASTKRPDILTGVAGGYSWAKCAEEYAHLYRTLVPPA